MLLDGLQRTYTLIDADTEMEKKSAEEYQKFLKNKLRLEIYVEINKFGILYRMLTLNTGQTPMSARHQLEMLYSDMLNTEFEGVKLVTDKDGKADPDPQIINNQKRVIHQILHNLVFICLIVCHFIQDT